MRMFLSFFVACLVFSSRSCEAAELKDLLFTKVHADIDLRDYVPLRSHGVPGAEEAKAEEKQARLRRLANLKDGSPRFDALDYLRDSAAFEARPGQVAIYLSGERALILTGTAEDHERLDSFMMMPGLWQHSIKQLELTLSAWAYLDDPAALVNNKVATFEEIRAHAGNSLLPVDAHLVLTRSGNRALSTNQLAGPDNAPKKAEAAGADEKVLKTPGSTFEVEPVIGPSGDALDFQVEYRARIPQPNAPDLTLSVNTNASLRDGKNIVVQNLQFPPLDGQDPKKVRRCAIIVGARILQADPAEDVKLTMAERETRHWQLIADAFEGLPGFAPVPKPAGEKP